MLPLDSDGKASLVPEDIDNGSLIGFCGLTTKTLDKMAFNCAHIGENQVTLTVEDSFGNTATCSAAVTVTNGDFDVDDCTESSETSESSSDESD